MVGPSSEFFSPPVVGRKMLELAQVQMRLNTKGVLLVLVNMENSHEA
jgi:hypothetical protein